MAAKKPLAPLSQRVKTDPALLKRALADPGLRSKLGDNQLSPDLLAARRTNQFQTNLGDVTKSLSGKTLVDTAKRIVDAKYKPQEAALDSQQSEAIKGRDVQQAYSSDYDKGLAGAFAGSQAAQDASSTAAKQAAVDARVRSIAQFQEMQKQAAQRAAEDAALRGSHLSGGADQIVGDAQQQAQAQSLNQADSQVATANQLGDVQSAFLRQVAGAAALHGQEAQRDIGTRAANTIGDVNAKRTELAANRGNDTADTLLKMRNDERDAYITQRGLSDKMTQAKMDAAAAASKIKSNEDLTRWKENLRASLVQAGLSSKEAIAEANREAANQRARLGRIVSRKNTADRLGAAGDTRRFSAANLRTNATKRDAAINGAVAHGTKNTKTGKEIPRGEANAQLKAKYGTEFGNAATDILYSKDHKVLPRVAAAIKRRYGIDVPAKYRR